MTDIIKADQVQTEKLSRQSPSKNKRGQGREQKVQLKPAEQSQQAETIAATPAEQAAIDLADAELVSMARAYKTRAAENYSRFADFTRMMQAQTVSAIRGEIADKLGVDVETMYDADAIEQAD